MFHRERFEVEYQRLYTEIGLGTTIFSPLASGLLSGKYNDVMPNDTRINLSGMEWLKERTINEEGMDKINKVKQLKVLTDKIGVSLPQFAINWCLKNNNVSTVILGASKLTQLVVNLKSLAIAVKYDEILTEQIENILKNKPKIINF